mgnify:CR=1 FL=1
MSPPGAYEGGPVLGIETSCDETSAAVVSGDGRLLGHVILSQDAHERFGGCLLYTSPSPRD